MNMHYFNDNESLKKQDKLWKHRTGQDRACHGNDGIWRMMKWTIVGMHGAVGTDSTAVALPLVTEVW